MTQLALPLRLADHAVFASFFDRGNESLVATLHDVARGIADGAGCWLWGGAATGKTHLLQAVCESAGDRSVYVPLSMFVEAGPLILDGLETSAVCPLQSALRCGPAACSGLEVSAARMSHPARGSRQSFVAIAGLSRSYTW